MFEVKKQFQDSGLIPGPLGTFYPAVKSKTNYQINTAYQGSVYPHFPFSLFFLQPLLDPADNL
jgi:hypothetical protein